MLKMRDERIREAYDLCGFHAFIVMMISLAILFFVNWWFPSGSAYQMEVLLLPAAAAIISFMIEVVWKDIFSLSNKGRGVLISLCLFGISVFGLSVILFYLSVSSFHETFNFHEIVLLIISLGIFLWSCIFLIKVSSFMPRKKNII